MGKNPPKLRPPRDHIATDPDRGFDPDPYVPGPGDGYEVVMERERNKPDPYIPPGDASKDLHHHEPVHPRAFIYEDSLNPLSQLRNEHLKPDPVPMPVSGDVSKLLCRFYKSAVDIPGATRIRWVFARVASRLALDLPHDRELVKALEGLLEIRNEYLKNPPSNL
jgi:hypothetical protein